MIVQIYRTVRLKVAGEPEEDRIAELIRLVRAADLANRAAYDRLRNSRFDQEAADILLGADHLRRRDAVQDPELDLPAPDILLSAPHIKHLPAVQSARL
jgi:hypothetical protein